MKRSSPRGRRTKRPLRVYWVAELARRGLGLEVQAPVLEAVGHAAVAGPPGQGPQSRCGLAVDADRLLSATVLDGEQLVAPCE